MWRYDILTCEDIDDFTDIKFVLYIVLKFVGSSSKVFGNLRTSSGIFGNSRKMFGSIRVAFVTILEKLRKSSESGWKSSENQKRRDQYIYITSSNQRLWECVRCHINVYPDTLNDFPSWLSTSKNPAFFINNRGFTERYFSDKVHASLIDWWLSCMTAPVSVDSHV